MTTRRKGATSTHTTFYKGSPIRIIFRDGSQLIAKFLEKRSMKQMRVKLADGEIRDINIGEIRSCGYYKPLKHER